MSVIKFDFGIWKSYCSAIQYWIAHLDKPHREACVPCNYMCGTANYFNLVESRHLKQIHILKVVHKNVYVASSQILYSFITFWSIIL